jgi:hypothetical protein
VAEPDLIQQRDSGELLAVRRFEETPLTAKFLVVPYREVSAEDGFVLTAYLTSRPSSSRRPGRWLVHTRHAGQSWVVVVEPDLEQDFVMVVTAYPSTPRS